MTLCIPEQTRGLESDVAFVILCPEPNVAGLRCTASSAKSSYPEAQILCVAGDHADERDLEELNRFCPTIKAGKTFTSLINTGVRNSQRQWNCTVVAGNVMRPSLLRKYQYWLKGDREILYAVVDRNAWVFENATINGMLLSKKALEEVGDFPEDESLVFSKLLWAVQALDLGYTLKGVVGARI